MLIFDTESYIWACLGLCFIFSLFFFLLFKELTWAKRALDSSHCPASHRQSLLCTALQDFFWSGVVGGGLYPQSSVPSICFLGERAARQGLVHGQDKLLFSSPDKGLKTTLCSIMGSTQTHTRTHLHKRHSSAPIHPSGHRSGHSNMARCSHSAVEHAHKGHRSLWTRRLWLSLFARPQSSSRSVCMFHHISAPCVGTLHE